MTADPFARFPAYYDTAGERLGPEGKAAVWLLEQVVGRSLEACSAFRTTTPGRPPAGGRPCARDMMDGAPDAYDALVGRNRELLAGARSVPAAWRAVRGAAFELWDHAEAIAGEFGNERKDFRPFWRPTSCPFLAGSLDGRHYAARHAISGGREFGEPASAVLADFAARAMDSNDRMRSFAMGRAMALQTDLRACAAGDTGVQALLAAAKGDLDAAASGAVRLPDAGDSLVGVVIAGGEKPRDGELVRETLGVLSRALPWETALATMEAADRGSDVWTYCGYSGRHFAGVAASAGAGNPDWRGYHPVTAGLMSLPLAGMLLINDRAVVAAGGDRSLEREIVPQCVDRGIEVYTARRAERGREGQVAHVQIIDRERCFDEFASQPLQPFDVAAQAEGPARQRGPEARGREERGAAMAM